MDESNKHVNLSHLRIIKEYIDDKDETIIDGGGLITTKDGIAGLRVWGGKFQYKQTDGTWADISDVSGSGSGDIPITDSELADKSDIDSLFP